MSIKVKGHMTYDGQHHRFTSTAQSPVLTPTTPARGTTTVDEYGNMEFTPDPVHISVPPQMTTIAQGAHYRVRRSSLHYIVSIKLPIVQSHAESEAIHTQAWAEAMGEITLDRRTIADSMA